jgi:predicted kinase
MDLGTIFLLIGPKGSGKSHIGSLFESKFGIKFVRVENWALEIIKDRSVNDDAYIREIFDVIEEGIREEMATYKNLVFESTGLSSHFDKMLKQLQDDFHVITIQVQADRELCLRRLKSRDQSVHVRVSDEQVGVINKLIADKEIKTDFVIDNNADAPLSLETQIRRVLMDKDFILAQRLSNSL